MSYTVRIRNNKTKEIRTTTPYEFEFNKYWWLDGNFSCDCNLLWEFLRAGGEEITEDSKCSQGNFTAIDATMKDGTIIKLEGE